MLYFPQLVTGATAQYPFVKRRIFRTITNTTPDGRLIRLSDPGGSRLEWELNFAALTTPERAEIEAFYLSAEGRLAEFTFLDPTENLLVWSEDLSATAWSKEPLLSLASGVNDPDGGTGATRVTNTGAAAQTLQQTIHGLSSYHYCFSVYARSEGSESLNIYRTAGGVEDARGYTLTNAWRRLAHAGKSQGVEDCVTFGIRLGAGLAVELYGMQAEAQLAPSAYRKTTSRSGVHERARFDSDSLMLVSEGPEQHSCTVRIVAPLGI